jgi:amino acid adenylation domain-containing protein
MMNSDEQTLQQGVFSPQRQALLQKWMQGQEPQGRGQPVIPPHPPEEAAPLSFAQQRLWFMDQLEPGNPAYNMPVVMHVRGPLKVSVFFRSVQTLARRHTILRTSFRRQGEEVVQIPLQEKEIPCRVVSVEQPLGEQERAKTIQRLIEDEIYQPFHLDQAPLMRVTLLKLDSEEFLLVLSMHHIITDGWSLHILFREIGEIYTAYLHEETPHLPPLEIQYADFAHWQRQRQQENEQHIAYWKQRLQQAPPVTELTPDFARPARLTFLGRNHVSRIGPELTARLKRLSQGEHTTLFMTLLAAFQMLLYRYTDQTDMVIGTRVAGREVPQTESLIGFFVNALALRSKIEGHLTFRELLKQTREQTLDAYAHQSVQFEQLVEELHPERDINYPPLFQIMFGLNSYPEPERRFGGIEMRPVNYERKYVKYNLDVMLTEEEGTLECDIQYNVQLYKASTIQRVAQLYISVLEQIVRNPDQALVDYEFMLPQEARQIRQWNTTAQPYPLDRCLPQIFEEEVKRNPEAVAVYFQDQYLTYAEVNQQANQLATYLREIGIGPEIPVGVCLERSPALLIALLAILKAGGVYVPLDPTYPEEHLRSIVQGAHLAVLLTTQVLQQKVAGGVPTTICLDEEETTRKLNALATANLPPNLQPANLLFIMYTSGSTGKPKGVAVEHRQILNRFFWMWRSFPFTAEEVACQRTTASFSVSIWEFLGPLLKGVPLVIVPDAILHNTTRFLETLQKYNVTRLVLVPSLLRLLLESMESSGLRLPRLKICSVCGEALSPELVRHFYALLPQAALINQYGASEVNDATYFDTRALTEDQGSVPVGKPVDNLQIHILDTRLRPRPIGVPGEVYIASPFPARCYIGLPDGTAESFIPDPFGEPGTRLYRTGDIARYREDGQIEHLGRRDRRIKLHGVRVELDGISKVLRQHPDVKQCAVGVRTQGGLADQLIAYIVLFPGKSVSEGSLRTFLQKQLPAFLHPNLFYFLDALPTTPNGKLDWQTLARLEPAKGSSSPARARVISTLEELLLSWWQELLEVEEVDVEDNFFVLGGHSLLAMQLITRVHDYLYVDIPIRTFLEAPTVSNLALTIEEQLQTAQDNPVLSLILAASDMNDEKSREASAPYFLSRSQKHKDRQEFDKKGCI